MPYVEYSSCIRPVSKVFWATAIHQNSVNAQTPHYKDEHTTISNGLQRKQGHKVNWVILQHICVRTPRSTIPESWSEAVMVAQHPDNTLYVSFSHPREHMQSRYNYTKRVVDSQTNSPLYPVTDFWLMASSRQTHIFIGTLLEMFTLNKLYWYIFDSLLFTYICSTTISQASQEQMDS